MPIIITTLSAAHENMNYGGIYHNVFRVPSGPVQAILARELNPTRVTVTINEQGTINRALLPDGSGNYFILINEDIRKRYALEPGKEVILHIEPDNSDYGMPLPTEVAELWDVDEEAKTVFHSLTPGKQRGLLYMIGKPKGPDTRIKKAVQIHEYLKSTNGVIDSKELNAYIKADNANWK